MTDTIPEPPPRAPGTVRRSRVPLDPPPTEKLSVTCKICGHPSHFAACDARLPWWKRWLLRREFCCCTYGA